MIFQKTMEKDQGIPFSGILIINGSIFVNECVQNSPVFSKNTSYNRSKRGFLMFFFTILLTKVVKLAQKII